MHCLRCTRHGERAHGSRRALPWHRQAGGAGDESTGQDLMPDPVPPRFVASSPRGFGDLLAAELRSFGAADVRERALGVEFSGSIAIAYRACLESRVASRVFLVVADFDAPSDA